MTARLLSTAEAAERLGIDPSLVRLYCRQGRIQGAVKDGRDWTMPEVAVDRFAQLERRRGRRWPAKETR